MAILKMKVAALVAAFLPATINASTAFMDDAGIQGACTGSVCCSAGCNIDIGDFHGCNGGVTFATTCKDNFENPDGTLDVPGPSCQDVQVTLLRDPNGTPVFDLYHKPSKTYDRYSFSNCKIPNTAGQCTVNGGGCDTKLELAGASG